MSSHPLGFAVFAVAFVLVASVGGMWAMQIGPFARPSAPQELRAQIGPSIDTTSGLPASPYSPCSSLSLPGINGQTGAGVVWSTSNAAYNILTKQFIAKETLNTAVASGSSSFISSTCFEMRFTFQWLQTPQVGYEQFPFMLKVDSINYTTLAYNNGSAINAPVFAKVPNGAGSGWDWGLLVEDENSAWHPACPEDSQNATLRTSGCGWLRLGTNDGTVTDVFELVVVINRIGPFGYDSVYSPIGKVDAVRFEVGLPQGQVAGYYLPSTTYQLVIERN